ncbi:MAG TPA: phosphatase PAP2 family protein, partial [Candidatus Eisenbacteria bacterium]|nr:phosphatase PAP2 family protein [Candidatus Eisenbacteria bacterium]
IWTSSPAHAQENDAYRLTGQDAALLLGGAAALGIGKFLLDSRIQEVPPAGLDPDEIALEWDRDALGIPSVSAQSTGNVFLLAAAGAPTAVWGVTGGEGRTWSAAGRLWTVQAEASLIATGVSFLLKRAASRPRPYAYLPETDRPADSDYDVTAEHAFESFPSNHATVAWASALSGATHFAFSRPDLSGTTHFVSGVLAGGHATTAGILRVESGKHFPTDVVAGSLLGAATGLGVALLNRDEEPGQGSALRNCLLGAAAGTVLAVLFTPPASPWVD